MAAGYLLALDQGTTSTRAILFGSPAPLSALAKRPDPELGILYAVASALLTGFVLGMSRLVLELNRDLVGDGWLGWFVGMNFLHFAIFLFVICAAVLIVVSLATPAPDTAQVDSLTVGGGKSEPVPVIDARWRRTDVLASIGLVALVGALLFVRSFLQLWRNWS